MPRRQLEDTITITMAHYNYLSERSQRFAGLLGRAGVWANWYLKGRTNSKETADALVLIVQEFDDVVEQGD